MKNKKLSKSMIISGSIIILLFLVLGWLLFFELFGGIIKILSG